VLSRCCPSLPPPPGPTSRSRLPRFRGVAINQLQWLIARRARGTQNGAEAVPKGRWRGQLAGWVDVMFQNKREEICLSSLMLRMVRRLHAPIAVYVPSCPRGCAIRPHYSMPAAMPSSPRNNGRETSSNSIHRIETFKAETERATARLCTPFTRSTDPSIPPYFLAGSRE
jgi:hypothetical protein